MDAPVAIVSAAGLDPSTATTVSFFDPAVTFPVTVAALPSIDTHVTWALRGCQADPEVGQPF
jgi:hypothetical protein